MENQLEEQLSKVLSKSLELAEKTGEFVMDQAPDLLAEFYRWHIAEDVGLILMFLTVLFAIWKIRLIISDKDNESSYQTKIGGRYYETDEAPFIVYVIVGTVVSVFMMVGLIANIFDLVKILVAPKLYLIEYFLK